jgi:hypothetical protein
MRYNIMSNAAALKKIALQKDIETAEAAIAAGGGKSYVSTCPIGAPVNPTPGEGAGALVDVDDISVGD